MAVIMVAGEDLLLTHLLHPLHPVIIVMAVAVAVDLLLEVEAAAAAAHLVIQEVVIPACHLDLSLRCLLAAPLVVAAGEAAAVAAAVMDLQAQPCLHPSLSASHSRFDLNSVFTRNLHANQTSSNGFSISEMLVQQLECVN